MHMTAERSSGKTQLASNLVHRFAVAIYGLFCFAAMSSASLLYTMVVVIPIPPDVENTRGQKLPCSISHNLCSYLFKQ